MPKIRLFRASDRGSKTNQSLEEFVADQMAEKLRKEQESPIVREINGRSVNANGSNDTHQRQEVEKYCARIAQIMTEMGQKDDLDPHKQGITLKNLDTPKSSTRQQTTVTSSYLNRALSETEGEEIALSTKTNKAVTKKNDPPAMGSDKVVNVDEKEEEDSEYSTTELLNMVKAKLNDFEPEATANSGSSSSSDGGRDLSEKGSSDNNDKTVENIIEALSRVKIAMSESQSQRSDATPSSSNNRKAGRLHFPTSPAVKQKRNKIKAALDKDSKKIVSYPDDDAQHPAKRLGFRQKLRSPRPPKSPMKKSIAATPESEKTTSVVPSPKTTLPRAPKNSLMAKALSTPKKGTEAQDQESTQPAAHGLCFDTTTPSVSTNNVIFALDISSTTAKLKHESNPPKIEVLSPLSQGEDEIEVEAAQQTIVRTEPKSQRTVEEVLRWTDESQLLESNKELTPKHVPRDGPAWNFLNGNNKRKMKLRLKPQKAIQALRKRTERSPRQPIGVHSQSLVFNDRVEEDEDTMLEHKPDPPTSNCSSPVADDGTSNIRNEANLSKYVETLNEIEDYIKDAEEGIKSNSVEETPKPKRTTSERVDALFPMLDNMSREGSSVACSRTTVPMANKARSVPVKKTSFSANDQPSPIIEFQEEQLEADRSESFSTSGSGILSDDDIFSEEQNDDDVPNGSGEHMLVMSFSQSLDSQVMRDLDDDLDEIRSLSDLSAVVLEETAAVAKEFKMDMRSMKKYFCFT